MKFRASPVDQSSETAAHYPVQRYPLSIRLRALLWRWKWVLLGLFVVTLIQTVVSALAVTSPPTYPTVVAAKPISAGQLISEDDVSLAELPMNLPGRASAIDQIVDHYAVAPFIEEEPISTQHVVGEEFLAQAREGHGIVAVRIADNGGISMIKPGSTVDLYAPADEFAENREATLVAENVRVVATAVDPATGGIFRDVDNNVEFYLEISKTDITLILGYESSGPLVAVLTSAK